MKVTDILVCHHQTLRAVFNEVERAMDETGSVDEIIALAEVLGGVIRHHAEMESRLLFAPLDAALREGNHTGHFFGKHEEYFEMLDRVGKQPPGQTTKSTLKAALTTLRHHLDVEEQVVIPAAEKTLTPASQDTLAQAWLQWNKDAVISAAR